MMNDSDKDQGKEKRKLRDFRLAKPVPADHPIYKRGPQFGFVSALPGSIKAAQSRRKTEE